MACRRLDPLELLRRVDAKRLGFGSTCELCEQPLPWIGQQRAEAAARFGLAIELPGYNMLVVGEVGTGRRTLMRQLMRAHAATRPVPPDLCFVHHVEHPEQPLALRFPAGQGRVLRHCMAQLARQLQTEVPRRLGEPDVKAESRRIEQVYRDEESRAYAELSAYARAHRFSLVREQGQLVFTCQDENGKPLTTAQAMAMSPQQRIDVEQSEAWLREQIHDFLDKTRAMERVMNEGLSVLRRQVVKPLLERQWQGVRNTVHAEAAEQPDFERWLDALQQHVIEHVELFENSASDEALRLEALEDLLAGLRVNLAVDNHGLSGAPAIEEDNPSHRQLLGCIEYEPDGDMLVTDFMRIRAGSLLRAHGGYLMLHLRDVLADAPVWEKLRRYVRCGFLQIEEPGVLNAPLAAVSLTPQTVRAQVKLVMLASPEEYEAVQMLDPDLAQRFRCKVDFADSFTASPMTWQETAVFVAHTCARWGLPHCGPTAVAMLIEHSHRLAQDQHRQSAVFADTEALVMESASCASARQGLEVQAGDVLQALRARRYRHDAPQERLLDALAQGERVMPLTGQMQASVNGLSVVQYGDHAFGFPVRITARVQAGDKGLISIDREVELSGPVHDKGVLVLQSYLTALFAHLAPLAFDASLVFEQEYGGIEGDSASLAELCALLSALAAVPVAQGLAVTGAFNSRGDLLPVGGINEKIEGFFRCCERLGLDGTQGVLIPARNCRHLMLDECVVEAVAQGRFHIHAADSVAEVMTLLSGMCWGAGLAKVYPADSLLGRAQAQLRRQRQALDAAGTRHDKPVHRRRTQQGG